VFGANFAIRKSTLLRVGGFHPDGVHWELRIFRGDGETAVSEAIDRLGLRSLYHPDAAIEHRVPTARMTTSYFERRAFLQGISDSFADLKAQARSRDSFQLRARRYARRAVGELQRSRRARRLTPLARSMEASHRKGYDFHRRQVETDAAVRAWVNRVDYWDAAIPTADARAV
jgi:hypothetical protein